MLTKLTIENPEQWYKYVAKVQSCINGTYQRSIKTTPFELIFGIRMRNVDNEVHEIIKTVKSLIILQKNENNSEQKQKRKLKKLHSKTENNDRYEIEKSWTT